jgi:hypothetical protein
MTETIHMLRVQNLQRHENLQFRRDDATAHMGRANTTALRKLFPQQVIYGFGDAAWPPRSPDLTAVGQQNNVHGLEARIQEGTSQFQKKYFGKRCRVLSLVFSGAFNRAVVN